MKSIYGKTHYGTCFRIRNEKTLELWNDNISYKLEVKNSTINFEHILMRDIKEEGKEYKEGIKEICVYRNKDGIYACDFLIRNYGKGNCIKEIKIYGPELECQTY